MSSTSFSSLRLKGSLLTKVRECLWNGLLKRPPIRSTSSKAKQEREIPGLDASRLLSCLISPLGSALLPSDGVKRLSLAEAGLGLASSWLHTEGNGAKMFWS